jgi:hypothetical protein
LYFRKNERLAEFIDGANLSSAVSALDLGIDFRGSAGFSAKSAIFARIYSYATLPNEKADGRQEKLPAKAAWPLIWPSNRCASLRALTKLFSRQA